MSLRNLTDKEIIEQVKNWNFGFICVNPNAGYSGTTRLIKIQNLISKEIITCCYHHAKTNKVRFPKYENMIVKNELNKLKYDFICLNTWVKNHRRIAKLQHLISKEVITCNYQCAKKNIVYFPKYEDINTLNTLNKLKFGWICLDSYIVKQVRMVKLKHLISKEIIICKYQTAKINNIRFPQYENMKRFDNINQLGLKSNTQYICVSPNCGKNKSNHVFCSIKRRDGLGKIKIVDYSSLKKGHNPYNESQNRVELEQVHPLYKRMFKRLGLKFSTMKLGKGSVIDFKVTHPNSNIVDVIETKKSEKWHGYSTDQKIRYSKLANLKQYNIHKIYFSDPKGSHKKHGFISIHELEKNLIRDFGL